MVTGRRGEHVLRKFITLVLALALIIGGRLFLWPGPTVRFMAAGAVLAFVGCAIILEDYIKRGEAGMMR